MFFQLESSPLSYITFRSSNNNEEANSYNVMHSGCKKAKIPRSVEKRKFNCFLQGTIQRIAMLPRNSTWYEEIRNRVAVHNHHQRRIVLIKYLIRLFWADDEYEEHSRR